MKAIKKIVEGIKRDLEPKRINYKKTKSMKELHYILGKHWKIFLSEDSKKIIDNFLKNLDLLPK